MQQMYRNNEKLPKKKVIKLKLFIILMNMKII